MSEAAILYVLLAACALSLLGIAGGALYHWRAMRRLQRQITDATIEARVYGQIAEEYRWKNALRTRRGISTLKGGKYE